MDHEPWQWRYLVLKVDFLSWRIGPSRRTRFWLRYLYHHQPWPTFEILWHSHVLKCLFLSKFSLSLRNKKLPKVYWWCLMNATSLSLFHQNRVKRINQRRGCLTDNLFFSDKNNKAYNNNVLCVLTSNGQNIFLFVSFLCQNVFSLKVKNDIMT